MLILLTLLILVAIFILMGIYCNQNLKSDICKLGFKNLPEDFEGYRIAQISDLHNTTYPNDNEKILKALKNARPNIIVITGDMIDSRRTDIKSAVELAGKIKKIAPCYYVCGNHEARMPENYQLLLSKLRAAGINTLQNDKIHLSKGDGAITLIGAEDPYVIRRVTDKPNSEILSEALAKLKEGEEENFTILLVHRPEHFAVYQDYGIDLALTGHTHGGQIRLPLIGGLFAPNQGFLPKLDAGIFRKQRTTLFISRGTGHSQFPVRFLNPPEIPIIELTKE